MIPLLLVAALFFYLSFIGQAVISLLQAEDRRPLELVCGADRRAFAPSHRHHAPERLGDPGPNGRAVGDARPLPRCILRLPLEKAGPAPPKVRTVPHHRDRGPDLRRLAVAPVRLQVDLLRQRRHGELLPGCRALPRARLLRRPAPDRARGPRLRPALLVHARAPADPAGLGDDDSVGGLAHGPEGPRGVHAGDPDAEPHAALRHGVDRGLEGPLPEGRGRRLLPLCDEPPLRPGDPLPIDRPGGRPGPSPRHRLHPVPPRQALLAEHVPSRGS